MSSFLSPAPAKMKANNRHPLQASLGKMKSIKDSLPLVPFSLNFKQSLHCYPSYLSAKRIKDALRKHLEEEREPKQDRSFPSEINSSTWDSKRLKQTVLLHAQQT